MLITIQNFTLWTPPTSDKYAKPALESVPMLVKRRLSQCTRMTMQVIGSLLERVPEAVNYPQAFISYRGEVNRQFTINKELIEDKEVRPADFSLSVFNTPISQAAIYYKLKAGYDVISPKDNNFQDALTVAASSLFSQEAVILVYANESVRKEYESVLKNSGQAASVFIGAFSCIMRKGDKVGDKECGIETESIKTVQDFIDTAGKSIS